MEIVKIAVIGGGFGGLGVATLLAKQGHAVTLFEKNNQLGGRAGSFAAQGFRFDTGPSWYLMPDVFENFFNRLNERVEDHLDLIKLQPSCRVTFANEQLSLDITGDIKRDKKAFEALEPGAGQQLEQYLARAAYLHRTAMDQVLYKNYDSMKDFLNPRLLRKVRQLGLFGNSDRFVRQYFKDERLQQIIQFPLVFLGLSPRNAPAVYNLLGHVVFEQGVFYPRGGMHGVTQALVKLARQNNAKIKLNASVEHISTERGQCRGVFVNGQLHEADAVISDADRHHTETQLLDKPDRDHSERYWQNRTLAPSALLIYMGLNRQYKSLKHHNLVFSADQDRHFSQLFDQPTWPDDPSFYICAPSRTDPTVAPPGHENLFVLVPVAAGLEHTPKELEAYADKILATMERTLQLPDLRQSIVYKKLFAGKDFETKFNSFRGTGLGLAHTLQQTAVFRPGNRSKKVKNLFYVGADTHPGIGLPACLISAELVARRITPNGKRGKQ